MAEKETSIKQILIALDASPSSMSALENAVELASRMNAELVGLFVEDINLLRATQFPFAREISVFSTGFRRLEFSDLERQLRAQANRVRRIMEQITRGKNVPTHFRVARGVVAEEILDASKDADLLIIGKIGRSFPGFRGSGSTVRRIVVKRPGMTLIWHMQGYMARPVVVAYDGSESARKAIDVAVNLHRTQDGGIIVFIVAGNREDVPMLRREASEELKKKGESAAFRAMVRPGLVNLSHMLQREMAGPVVIPCDPELITGERLCSLIDEIPNPVLLVK